LPSCSSASGFLRKDAPEEQRLAPSGSQPTERHLLASGGRAGLIEEFARRTGPRKPPPTLAELTQRELEVLRLVARRLSNAEIADGSRRQRTQGEDARPHILAKLNLRDRVQAVVLAYESGLVVPASGPESA
jgi:DNA-binding NarL/FixJ family response regulator